MADAELRRKQRQGALTEADVARSGLLGQCGCQAVNCSYCDSNGVVGVLWRGGRDPHDRDPCAAPASTEIELTYLWRGKRRAVAVCSKCADYYVAVSSVWRRKGTE